MANFTNHYRTKYSPIRKHRLYGVWTSMQYRCKNPNSKFYSYYGGRGIGIEWESFTDFVDDMLPTYKEGLSLDRYDNNKGYSKLNCRWATPREQANNTRRNRLFLYRGDSLTLPEHARKIGLKSSTVRQRFYVFKWPLERCLEIKVG